MLCELNLATNGDEKFVFQCKYFIFTCTLKFVRQQCKNWHVMYGLRRPEINVNKGGKSVHTEEIHASLITDNNLTTFYFGIKNNM